LFEILYIQVGTKYKLISMKKGQSAMEYLMTYGWAILIVIIVAAALYALGVFTPSSSETEARFATLGTSPAHTLNSASGLFTVKLPNQVGKTIVVSSVEIEPTTGGAGCTNASAGLNIGPGQIADAIVSCTPANTTLTTLGLAATNSYSLKVTVTYTPQGGYQKTDTATVTGTVQ
jgi:hypothetical protein